MSWRTEKSQYFTLQQPSLRNAPLHVYFMPLQHELAFPLLLIKMWARRKDKWVGGGRACLCMCRVAKEGLRNLFILLPIPLLFLCVCVLFWPKFLRLAFLVAGQRSEPLLNKAGENGDGEAALCRLNWPIVRRGGGERFTRGWGVWWWWWNGGECCCSYTKATPGCGRKGVDEGRRTEQSNIPRYSSWGRNLDLAVLTLHILSGPSWHRKCWLGLWWWWWKNCEARTLLF